MLPQNEEGIFSNGIWILAKSYGGCFQVEKVHFQAPFFWISILQCI
jgi:hypothetical protein